MNFQSSKLGLNHIISPLRTWFENVILAATEVTLRCCGNENDVVASSNNDKIERHNLNWSKTRPFTPLQYNNIAKLQNHYDGMYDTIKYTTILFWNHAWGWGFLLSYPLFLRYLEVLILECKGCYFFLNLASKNNKMKNLSFLTSWK